MKERHFFDTKLPVIEDLYESDYHVIKWNNPGEKGHYLDKYPEVIRKWDNPEGRKNRILFVGDMESVARKSALFVLREKQERLSSLSYQNNRPLNQSQKSALEATELLQVDLQEEDLENFDKKWSIYLKKMTAWNGLFCTGWPNTELPAKCMRVLLGDYDGDLYVTVPREKFHHAQVQHLLLEGKCHVVWLPEEENDYFNKLAMDIFLTPAIQNTILQHPGLACDHPEELMLQENPYLGRVNLGELDGAIAKLRTIRGRKFNEMDILRFLNEIIVSGKGFLEYLQCGKLRRFSELDTLVGFQKIKLLLKQHIALYRAQKRNPKLRINGSCFLFVGNPGTGKTQGAKLFHEVLAAEGILSGDFVIADRKDIIAPYVGQTAPRVADLFDRAGSGVLFVDEAGFFLQKGIGGFAMEALKEFVRYIDSRRDVTVIFSLYPGEKDDFLELDAGLRSRISQVIEQEDLSAECLCELSEAMWREQGYLQPDGERERIIRFFEARRELSPGTFGNGREARKLVELSIREAELRILESGEETREETRGESLQILDCDLQKAMEELGRNLPDKKRSVPGFYPEQPGEILQGTKYPPARPECEAV